MALKRLAVIFLLKFLGLSKIAPLRTGLFAGLAECFSIHSLKHILKKVWGMRCGQISADWAAQRIKGLTMTSLLRSMIFKSATGNVVKTLIDEFDYPRLGPGQLWEEVADRVVASNGVLHLGHKVVDIERISANRYVVKAEKSDGSTSLFAASNVISSIPLSTLVYAIRPTSPEEVTAAAAKLSYRDFLVVALIVDTPFVFSDQWIYVHDPRVRVARIQNTKNWSPEMVCDSSQTVLLFEYFCDSSEDFWHRTDAALVDFASKELQVLNLAPLAEISDGTVVRVPRAYPVYDDSYRMHVEIIRNYISAEHPNIQPIGRNGMHRYNNQDHAAMTGFIAAENIIGLKQQVDPWQVNEEAHYLEERASNGVVLSDRLVPRRVSSEL